MFLKKLSIILIKLVQGHEPCALTADLQESIPTTGKLWDSTGPKSPLVWAQASAPSIKLNNVLYQVHNPEFFTSTIKQKYSTISNFSVYFISWILYVWKEMHIFWFSLII